MCFKMSEVASRIFAEAALLAACLLTVAQFLAELLPLVRISWTQVLSGEEASLAGNGCHQTDRSAYHDGGNGGFATSRSPFVITHGPETLFQVIVGRWQIWHVIGMKEPWGKAVGRLDHMINDLNLLLVKLWLNISDW